MRQEPRFKFVKPVMIEDVMPKTVAIVGRAKSRKDWTDNPAAHVWAMNDYAFHGLGGRVPDAVFEMHADVLGADRYDAGYKAWLQESHSFPVYMPEVDARIPASTKYPINAVSALYCNHVWVGRNEIGRFYTSTVCYMIALALFKQYRRIELYGIDLVSAPEYEKYRDAVFFWLGKATGLGVDVVTGESCPLFRETEYPMMTRPAEEIKTRLISG